MKKYLFIFFPFIIFIASCDKDSITEKQADSFIKYYGGSLLDEGVRVLSLENGGYLLMGNMETPDKGKEVCVILTDKFGNSTGPANLYGFNYDDYGNVIKKNQKGYIIAGSSEELTKGGRRNILLIQIKEDGSLDWINTISDPEYNANEVANDLIVLSDQSLVLTGHRDSVEIDVNKMFLVKTNADGEITSRFYKITKNNTVGTGIAETNENGLFILVGYEIIKSDVPSKRTYTIAWNGNTNKPFLAENETDNAYAVSIIPQEENNYLILCNVTSGNKKYIKIKKAFLGKDFELLWQKDFGENERDIVNYGFLHNNKLFLIGTSDNAVESTNEENFGNILFLEMENDGTLPVYHYVGDGVSFQGNGFDFTGDQGIVITGGNKLNGNTMITLIKLKSDYSL